MYKLIHEHMSVHSPISVHQWGFYEGKSTTSALISFTHDCLQHLDNGEEAYRRFYGHLDPHIMVKLYTTIIHPHLEYACTVWSPHLQKDIQSLENIQKFALRVSTGQWTAEYETLLSSLNTPSLATRRRRLKLSLLYNIINNNVNFPSNPMTCRQSHYSHRHVNSSALVEPSARSTQ